MIAQTVDRARKSGLPAVVTTFDPDPAEVIRPGRPPDRLTSVERRGRLIERLGVDGLWVLPFTPALARRTAAELVHELLVGHLHAVHVVVGRDFSFGESAQGDAIALERALGRCGSTADVLELATAEIGNRPAEIRVELSSTLVRACVAAGDVRRAGTVLGRPHLVEGVIVRSADGPRPPGRLTVAPLEHAAMPRPGRYAGSVVLDGRRVSATISVDDGSTPVLEERTLEIEAREVGASPYGERVGIEFVDRSGPGPPVPAAPPLGRGAGDIGIPPLYGHP